MEKKGLTYEILVAADGTDGTREMAEKLAALDSRIKVFGSAERGGKGRGVKEAMLKTQGRIIGYIDADNKTPITELDRFLPLLNDGCEVVIGSRKVTGSGQEVRKPLFRQLISFIYRTFTHMVVGLNDIQDTQCGFKFFLREPGLKLFQDQEIMGYAFDVEILYLARRAGYRIAQIPVLFKHDGDSRMSVISGNLKSLRDTLQIRRLHRH
jgi:dolichyl-phosphate beta-glucosyltransferase